MKDADKNVTFLHPEEGILFLRAAFVAEFGYEPNQVHIRRSDLRLLIPLPLGAGIPKRFYGMDIVVHPEDGWFRDDTAYLVTTKNEANQGSSS